MEENENYQEKSESVNEMKTGGTKVATLLLGNILNK